MFIKIVSKSSNFASSFKSNNLYCSSFLKFSLIKFLELRYLTSVGECFGKQDLVTLTVMLWWSDNHVSRAMVFWKFFLLLVSIRSIELGLIGFLMQVGPTTRLYKLYVSQIDFIAALSSLIDVYPSIRNSCFGKDSSIFVSVKTRKSKFISN